MSAQCPKEPRWLPFPGCRFEARYDEIMPESYTMDMEGFKGSVAAYRAAMAEKRASIVTRKYVHDVCVHCGLTIRRPQS